MEGKEGGEEETAFPSLPSPPLPSPPLRSPFLVVLVPTFPTNSRGNACYAGYPLFCSNSTKKCLIRPTECSPHKSLILHDILPAEFIQAYQTSLRNRPGDLQRSFC